MWRLMCVFVGLCGLCAPGCASPSVKEGGARVIFLDGAGWSGSHHRIRAGLRAAGYRGRVEDYPWSSLLGPGPDHFLVARKKAKGRQLAERIEKIRAKHPDDPIYLMGLSAGTAVVVFALEQLPPGMYVDHVVLFSPSMSDRHDLTKALQHVRGRLYATCSKYDGILAGVAVNADGVSGRPAGVQGLRMPSGVKRYDLYARVVNLPWRPAYAGFGWNGGHTSVTTKDFVQRVIAPRILTHKPHPLDRSVAAGERSALGPAIGLR